MYVVLGHSGDSCCAGVVGRLAARGKAARIVASPLASPAHFPWRLDRGGLTSRLDLGDDTPAIDGVLVRGTAWVDPLGWDPEDHTYMQAEMLAATLAWLAGLPCPVVNRPSATLWYRGRDSLMSWRPMLRRCGLPVPDQLITNDPAEARAFGHRFAAHGADGAVYAPLTSDISYLVATDAAWRGLAKVQERSPVCLTEPHGAAQPACIVGGEVVWDHEPPAEARALEPRLCRLATVSGLDFLEVVVAPFRGILGVVMVEPMPALEY